MRTETIRIESRDYAPAHWSAAILYICESNENTVLFRHGKYTSVRLELILDKVIADKPVTNVTITLVDEWDDEPYLVVRDENIEVLGYIDILQLLFD